ncbi:MAG: DNA-binding response regulator [Geminicoccaceae bacterium]|nr:DNA-binding response regulator [Geminicoccaceae bacterium]
MTLLRHRVLLVDDEPLARQRLRQLLSAAPDFDVAGECGDARRVRELVQSLRPDVVFLDIRMPFVDGFDAHAAIRSVARHVVFVTAHPEHGARAFDVEASDYLVKPVTQARFDAALQRLRRALAEPGAERVILGGRQGGTAVALSDLAWIEADGAYVTVHAAGRRHVLRESMAQIIERLGARRFVRVHRSAAINIAHVRGLKRAKRGLEVELTDGTRLPISRRKAREVVGLLRQEPPNVRPERGATADSRIG